MSGFKKLGIGRVRGAYISLIANNKRQMAISLSAQTLAHLIALQCRRVSVEFNSATSQARIVPGSEWKLPKRNGGFACTAAVELVEMFAFKKGRYSCELRQDGVYFSLFDLIEEAKLAREAADALSEYDAILDGDLDETEERRN